MAAGGERLVSGTESSLRECSNRPGTIRDTAIDGGQLDCKSQYG